jgi:hypothetical protein
VASYSGGTADHLTAQLGASSNRQDVFGGAVDAQSVSSDVLQSTPTEGDDKSLYSALSQGYAVGQSSAAGMKVVDPANFADDTAALQALNDWLVGLGSSVVTVWIPPKRSDGTNWLFPSTVEFGDTSETDRIPARVFLPWMGGGESGTTIGTTITNGDPIFRFVGAGQRGGAQTAGGSRLIGGHFSLGGQDASIVEWKDQSGWKMDQVRAYNINGDAIKITGACFGFEIGLVGLTMASNSSGRGVVFYQDTTNQRNPANGFIRDLVIDGTYDDAVTTGINSNSNRSDPGHIVVDGHYEGADGTALLNLVNGIWSIPDAVKLGLTTSGAHGIKVGPSSQVTIGNVVIGGSIDGDGILVDDGGAVDATVRISPDLNTTGFPAGDTINVQSAVEASVPYENMVEGSVTYPPPPWGAKYKYHDGWALQRDGTDTISAASSSVVSNFAGSQNVEHKAQVWIPSGSEPTGRVQYDYYWEFDPADNTHENLVVEELLGNTSVTVAYRVYTRRGW